jgi:hypothetical protein
MGVWNWFKENVVAPVSKVVKPFVAPVTKMIRKYVPGGNVALDATEALYNTFVGDTENDIKEVSDDVDETVEQARKTYERGRDAIDRTVNRGKNSFNKLREVGGQFYKTVTDPSQWQKHYLGDEEEEEIVPRRRRNRKRRAHDDVE